MAARNNIELVLNGQFDKYRRDSLDLSPTEDGTLLNGNMNPNRRESVDLSPMGEGNIFPFRMKKKMTRTRRLVKKAFIRVKIGLPDNL